MAIFYRLKTGCQWRQLPMKQFFRGKYSCQSVYYHFQKWSKDGSWKIVWTKVLDKYKHLLDMSSIQLDGTHTPTKRGGDAVGIPGRAKPAICLYYPTVKVFHWHVVMRYKEIIMTLLNWKK